MGSDTPGDSDEVRRHLIYLLHSLRLGLQALLLTYDARLGSFSRIAKIKTNCKLFFDGKLDLLYRNALKTLGHGAKRARQLTDGEREERKYKNARALCLQGNLSKAYSTIVQKGLATDDKIQLLHTSFFLYVWPPSSRHSTRDSQSTRHSRLERSCTRHSEH